MTNDREPSATHQGLTEAEAALRLEEWGPNQLPMAKPPGIVAVFLRQFLSPLIYILFAAAAVSLFLGDIQDALFIGIVLLIDGIIGAAQEYSSNRAAAALRKLEQPHATVVRDGRRQDIASRLLVPGDLVLLESGARVPADLRLVEASDLRCDESLLTGESMPVAKRVVAAEGDEEQDGRVGFLFAGTIVTRGRASGVVEKTGASTRIGQIAGYVGKEAEAKAPLIVRMEQFSRLIAVAVGVCIVLLIFAGIMRSMSFEDMFLLSVGLAVSAIPEGLPVAITVALAIGMRRMAKAGVIVRSMAAVESLGSCTMIATDKTGTLTLNELTVTDILLPDGTLLVCEAGQDIDACTIRTPDGDDVEGRRRAVWLLRAAALPNEADLLRTENGWEASGDTVDIALLAAVRKGGHTHAEVRERLPLVGRIPYEPEQKYAASFHRNGDEVMVFVKGAPETLVEMCGTMDTGEADDVPVDRERLLKQKDELAQQGLKVLAFATGDVSKVEGDFDRHQLTNLRFLGLVGMQDPVRPEVPQAIADCRRAGIEVTMITGDDPRTASTIAAEAGLGFRPDQIVTGVEVRAAEAAGEEELDSLTREARIYARVEPEQKLAIVRSMTRNGHFVAVTGDGVNDSPALRHAHVGVAMGRRGTDVAKESADIVVTDDNFASIVRGVLEGRIAYANIRKVVFMLVSTGAAEVLLFLLAIPFGLPMPLLPVQLLWLNIVAEGIQDVTLVAERAEGDELDYPPRRPKEPMFDRRMIRRIIIASVVMGLGSFAVFYTLLSQGHDEASARNLVLLLFVLFENFQTLNSRSERHTILRRFWSNPTLLLAIVAAQALHIAAMYIPGLSGTLKLQPVSVTDWAVLLVLASSVIVVSEIDKFLVRRRERLQR